MSILHKQFRRLCRALSEVDEWAQIILLNLLLRYARSNFAKPIPPKRDAATLESTPAARAESPEVVAAPVQQKKPVPARSLNDFYGQDSDDSDDESNSSSNSKPEATLLNIERPPVNEPDSADNSAVTSPVRGNNGGSMDDDLKLLLQSAVKLMKSRNSGVLLAVTKVYVHLGTANPKVLNDLADFLLGEVRHTRHCVRICCR